MKVFKFKGHLDVYAIQLDKEQRYNYTVVSIASQQSDNSLLEMHGFYLYNWSLETVMSGFTFQVSY